MQITTLSFISCVRDFRACAIPCTAMPFLAIPPISKASDLARIMGA